MSYQAVICRAKLRPHPGADKLTILDLGGFQVITGSSVDHDDLVCFFPCDGSLSNEFLFENSEYREGKGVNKDPTKFGFFEENGRVKAIKLRGEVSEGYSVPLSCLSYTGYDLSTLKDGDTFCELNGHQICEKYYTRATKQFMLKQLVQGVPRHKVRIPEFPEHFDTAQLRNLRGLPLDARFYFTEKLHGTSGRTTKMILPVPLKSKYKLLWNKFLCFLRFAFFQKFTFQTLEEVLVSGSRCRVLDPFSPYGYSDKYRKTSEDLFVNLDVGETAYYEIVGWTDNGGSIQKHGVDKKEFKDLHKAYGPTMHYSYGAPRGTSRVFVYRITQIQPDKTTRELPWEEVKLRCKHLGVNHVPELVRLDGTPDFKYIIDMAKTFSSGSSTLDTSHIREGVCLRTEHPNVSARQQCSKLKGAEFSMLEGLAKNDDNAVDIEEIS